MKKRITALMLVLVMLLAACAPAADKERDESTKESTKESTSEESVQSSETEPKTAYELELERRASISDELPELTFDGENFVIYGGDMLAIFNYADEYLGETFNDAIYERDNKIEARFDIELEIIPELNGDVSGTIRKAVQSNTNEFDLVSYQILQMGIDTVADVFLDMRTVPHINFDKPWWSSYTSDLLTLSGRTFVSVGSFNITNIAKAIGMLYNHDLAAEYNLPDIYDIVLEGKWTVDKLNETVANTYRDLNADGVKNPSDRYGLYISGGDAGYCLYAFEKTLVEFDESGNIVTDRLYDEKLIAIAEKLYSLHFENADVYFENALAASPSHFNSGNALMINANPEVVSWGLLDTDINYSFIPQPKWDENQEKYLTGVNGSSDAQAVLKTASNLDMIGAVTEALNAETWKTVEYPYYEKVLKGRQLQDARNVQILDLIMEGRVYDFGYIYGGQTWNTSGGGASEWIDLMLGRYKSKDITSFVEARIGKWDKYIQKVADYFANYQD